MIMNRLYQLPLLLLFLTGCHKSVDHTRMEHLLEARVQQALEQNQITTENYISLYQTFELEALAEQGISDPSEISTQDWALLNVFEERMEKKIEEALKSKKNSGD